MPQSRQPMLSKLERQLAISINSYRNSAGANSHITSFFHNPDIASRNLQPKFDSMRRNDNATELRGWQRGKTGYPIVDAGMRELWTTGWMHNRARMVVDLNLGNWTVQNWSFPM